MGAPIALWALIDCMASLAALDQLAVGYQDGQQAFGLVPIQATQLHDIRPLDGAMLLDKPEHHLALLLGVEAGLPDVLGSLTELPVEFGAHRIAAAPAGTVGLGQAGLDEFFNGYPGLVLVLDLNCRGELRQRRALHRLELGQDDQGIDRQGPTVLLFLLDDGLHERQVGRSGIDGHHHGFDRAAAIGRRRVRPYLSEPS